MEDLLLKIRKTQFLDENNSFIIKEEYKEEEFNHNIFFKINRNELDENDIEECRNDIIPLLNNKKLIICNLPIVRYETKSYSINENNSIENINEHLNKNGVVLLYAPIKINGILLYNTKFL
jgi:hypothetical protein